VTLAEIEKRAILSAIKRADGNYSAAARELGIGKTTIYRKLSEYFPKRKKSAKWTKGMKTRKRLAAARSRNTRRQ
jgi:DNA-binding NtrC family response regulator